MLFFSIFSLLAIVIKLIIVSVNKIPVRAYSRWFLVFFCFLFFANIFEFISFFYPQSVSGALIVLSCYYVSVCIVTASFFGLCIDAVDKTSKVVAATIAGSTIIITAMFCYPGLILADAAYIGYTYTRVPGPAYWVFQLYMIGMAMGSFIVLTSFAFFSNDGNIKLRARALLIAATPMIFVVIFVVILMQLGFHITGAIFGSGATTLFLLALIATKSEIALISPGKNTEGMFTFLSLVPAMPEFFFAKNVRESMFSECELDLEKTKDILEKAIINDTINACNGNKTEAAKILGISRATLRRKLG